MGLDVRRVNGKRIIQITDEKTGSDESVYERIAKAIVKEAIQNYKLCIRHQVLYRDKVQNFKGMTEADSCASIIRDIESNRFINLVYDIEWEYVFRKIDREMNEYYYRYWRNVEPDMSGIYPYDFVHNLSGINNPALDIH